MGNAISSCSPWNVIMLPSPRYASTFFFPLMFLSILCACIPDAPSSPLLFFLNLSFLPCSTLCAGPSLWPSLVPPGLHQHRWQLGMDWGGVDVTLNVDPHSGGCEGCGCCAAGLEQRQSSGFTPAELCQPVPTPKDPDLCEVSHGKGLWWQWPPHQAARSLVASLSVESRHFLCGYLFWESSKISGSQFNCATSQLPERIEYDHITWNACRVCYSNCISKRQHIWWLVLFGIISISWWCFIQKGCSLKG